MNQGEDLVRESEHTPSRSPQGGPTTGGQDRDWLALVLPVIRTRRVTRSFLLLPILKGRDVVALFGRSLVVARKGRDDPIPEDCYKAEGPELVERGLARPDQVIPLDDITRVRVVPPSRIDANSYYRVETAKQRVSSSPGRGGATNPNSPSRPRSASPRSSLRSHSGSALRFSCPGCSSRGCACSPIGRRARQPPVDRYRDHPRAARAVRPDLRPRQHPCPGPRRSKAPNRAPGLVARQPLLMRRLGLALRIAGALLGRDLPPPGPDRREGLPDGRDRYARRLGGQPVLDLGPVWPPPRDGLPRLRPLETRRGGRAGSRSEAPDPLPPRLPGRRAEQPESDLDAGRRGGPPIAADHRGVAPALAVPVRPAPGPHRPDHPRRGRRRHAEEHPALPRQARAVRGGRRARRALRHARRGPALRGRLDW